ncbi:tRNA (adenosine(37)-N6)-threonylcarbamoyltransferase complex transferase subunit TsaD [Patescibacteria group bacterium]|nr:tRNA (adenosine(37)-N6)-threonylcarbamoyltransferase complex transferase subunit TsaD [Patescibacteria group bacterium]
MANTNFPKIILGIESSCDETAAAVLTNDGKRITILSNVVASSASLQAKYGGIIPEQAARQQLKSIIPVISEALAEAFPQLPATNNQLHAPVDAIAVTFGPGLIGSLLVGVETAKVLSKIWNKPLIPVNHLIGHFYANWINTTNYQLPTTPQFPILGLLVSGGHTDLVLFKEHGKYQYLGGTRDDATGECFDKCARLLGLPYPGGPQIAKLAKSGNPRAFALPRPMIDSKDFDFSFSGLKTAVANLLKEYEKTAKPRARKNAVQLSALSSLGILRQILGAKQTSSERSGRANGFFSRGELADVAASIEQAIIDVLVEKTIRAAQTFNIDQIMIAGGVAANQKLQEDLRLKIKELGIEISLHVPPPELCTDNAAMIASAAFFQKPAKNPLTTQANPNLSLLV